VACFGLLKALERLSLPKTGVCHSLAVEAGGQRAYVHFIAAAALKQKTATRGNKWQSLSFANR
jgi:hypothetical protein